MAPLIVIFLYGIMFILIKAVAPLEMNNEVRLLFNIVGGIGFLILPIAIFSIIDIRLTKRAVNVVGEIWCLENNVDFEKVEMHKNHFSLIYRNSGSKAYKKFRVRFLFTTWFIKTVEWL